MTEDEYEHMLRIDSMISDDLTAKMVNCISMNEVDNLLFLMVNNLTIKEAKKLFPIPMVEGSVGTELASLFSNNVMTGVKTSDLSPLERRNIISTRLFLKAKLHPGTGLLDSAEKSTGSAKGLGRK